MTRWAMPSWCFGWLLFCLAGSGGGDAAAQRRPQDPHLAYAYPAGCQQGTSCEIVLGGQYLKEAQTPHVSGSGVEVEVVKWYRPLTQGEYNQLNMALEDARKELIDERRANNQPGMPSPEEVALKAGITPEQQIEMQIYRQRDRDPKRQPNEQLAEEVTIRLTVAADALPGKRELRMLTENSMSNPIWIRVGQWAEMRETEPNDRTPQAVTEAFPLVVNGQIMPGDVDSFSFEARKGMRLVIDAAARDVIPYLADAVPGWFQAVMALLDENGNELSYADSFHYRQDPVIYFEVPRDGRYTIQIRDSLYRGREDFVYRLTLGELPFVTSIFPLGARTDSEVSVELTGWNLSQSSLEVKTQSRRSYRPVRWFTVPQAGGASIRFPLQIDHLPEVLDQEPNNDASTAQPITTRTIVNGRIDHPGDQDVFRIEGSGRLVVEVQARRHGSPLDSVVTVTDTSGKELAFNDDYEDKSQAFSTHHADSHFEVTLPTTGTFLLNLSDAQRNGGKDFVYRLYLRAPQPDYELRVTPSSIIARAGAVVPITVFALRRDGFAEDIELTLVDAPAGFRLDGGVIPGHADRVRLTLTVPATPPAGPTALEMEGKARRGSGSMASLSRPAVPAENMMQAFAWFHLVPVEEWNVIVSGSPGPRVPFELLMPAPRIKLPKGGVANLVARPLVKNIPVADLRVELNEPPKGVTAAIVTDASGAFGIQLRADAAEAQPGERGNLLAFLYRETTPAPTTTNPNPRTQRTEYGYLPAIPFEIPGQKGGR